MYSTVVSKRPINMFRKRAVAVLALVILFVSLPVGKAYAWTYYNSAGRPGAASGTTIYIGDLYMPWGGNQFTLYSNIGPVAYRSPATTGAQVVSAIYAVENWTGAGWVVTAKTDIFTGKIGANQSYYRFPTPYIQPIQSRGIFRVSFIYFWRSSTGVFLGSTQVISHLATDHVCLTSYRLCKSYPGYFQTGGYQTGTW